MASHEGLDSGRKNLAGDVGRTPDPEIAIPDGSWFARNGPYLVLFAAVMGYFYYKGFDLDDYWSLVKAALGLGLVIFVHELGHFLVAKWCDVHVETFSIGFGPPLPGCCFIWGETTYMVGLFPLGGYVKMIGEGAENDEGDVDPRSFKNKTVFQRMAIISAGVIMNVVLAFGCFVFVFMTRGAEQTVGVIDTIDAGAPAWKVGVQTGDIIHQIGNETNDPSFNKVQPVIMLSREGEALPFVFSAPNTPPKDWTRTEVVPRRNDDDLYPRLGFGPASKLELLPARSRKVQEIPVLYNSVAATAEPPFEFGDTIVGCTDPDHPDQVTVLPIDPRNETGKQRDYFEFGRRMKRLAGKPVVIRVQREVGGESTSIGTTVDIKVPPAFHLTFGMRMRMGKISAVRDHSAALRAGVEVGDIIEQVDVVDARGLAVRFVNSRSKTPLPRNVVEKDLDPERLRFELEAWAAEKPKNLDVALTVLRNNPLPRDGNPDNHKELRRQPITVRWDDSWRFNRELPLGFSSPMAIPELGVAYRIETTVEDVPPDSIAAKAGIQRGDVIKEIRPYFRGKKRDDKPKPDNWFELMSFQWAHIEYLLNVAVVEQFDLRLERNKSIKEVTIAPVEDKTWPQVERGLLFIQDTYLQKADGLTQAIGMGVDKTTNFIMQIYGNLRGFATGRLSTKMLGGPILIGTAAFGFAGRNFYEFITFLGIISVNLAVINFLPIPVLDGGHMVFLIYEKLRGRPVPEQARLGATYLGLALIASLIIFVVVMDVKRLFF